MTYGDFIDKNPNLFGSIVVLVIIGIVMAFIDGVSIDDYLGIFAIVMGVFVFCWAYNKYDPYKVINKYGVEN